MLSRSESQHLDDLSDSEVEDWVNRWSNLRAVSKVAPRKAPIREAAIVEQVPRRLVYLKVNEAKHPSTIAEHSRNLFRYALPYFVNQAKCQTLGQCKSEAKELRGWLVSDAHLSPKKLRSVNQTLSKFWRWANEEGLVEGGLILRRLPIKANRIPLQFTLKPSEVLRWSSRRSDI